MTDFDPLKTDNYAKRLGELNETVGVVSSENIYNQKGALLVKSGEKLGKNTIDKLLQHRLMKPLQDCVQIEDAYDGVKLYEHIVSWLHEYDDLKAVHESSRLDKSLKTMCNIMVKHKQLQQMITVLAHQLPKVFEQGCFCAWLSISICQQLRLEPSESIAVFIAGFCHDVGFLHINPELLEKQTQEYTPEEWRMIQSHPVIGQVITKSISGLNKLVPRAILEHQECCDGTGYPQGKSEEKLEVAGQIVALCDALYLLRFNEKKDVTNLKNLQPFLQINHTTYKHSNYAAIVAVINKADLKTKATITDEDFPQFCQALLDKYEIITAWATKLNEVMKKIPESTSQKIQDRVQRIHLHIVYIVKSSGLFNLGIRRWLEHLKKSPCQHAYIEVEQIEIMYDEVLCYIKKLYQLMREINQDALKDGCFDLNQDVMELSELNNNRIPETMKGQEFDIEQIV